MHYSKMCIRDRAYVTSWGESTPDPACLTHINYAFGHVTDNFKGIRIDNEPRLQMVVGPVSYPHLDVYKSQIVFRMTNYI